MKRPILISILLVVILFTTSCGLLSPPAPQPQLSATDLPPKATAMSELPPTWTPEPTHTPSNTPPPSPTPTITPDPNMFNISAVMTPMAAAYPVEVADRTGWILIEGKTASISVPPGYEVLDFAGVFMEMMFGVMEAFAEGMVEFAGELGEELGATPAATQPEIDLGEPPDFDFIITMEEATKSGIILVSVDKEPWTSTETLLNEALSDDDAGSNLVSREILVDAPYPMERVILDVEDEELGPGKQIIYVILGEKMAWNLVFTTPATLFESHLPLFESVVDEFFTHTIKTISRLNKKRFPCENRFL